MSLRNIGIVYRKELIDSLRDRRTVISMIVVPLVLIPLLTIGLGVVLVRQVRQAREEVPNVMILGGGDSPKVRAELEKLEGVQIVPQKPDYAEEISSKQIRAVVEIPAGFDAKLAAGEPMSVKIYMYEGELKSGFGAERLQNFFRDLRDRTIRERLEARRLPESMIRPFDIRQQNVAPPEKVSGALLGGLVPYFVILLCLTGAMYPAMDLTAGEKERGTIETILCSPVSRTHLVLGKFLMVLTASVATAVLSGRISYHIREEHSLSYAAFARFYDQAIPVGGAYVSTPKPDEALALVHQAIRELATLRFNRYSLGRFIDGYRFNYLVDNATAERQADFLARAELYLGSFRKGEESLQLLHRVLPEDLAPIVYAHMGNIHYAYLGDTTRMHGRW